MVKCPFGVIPFRSVGRISCIQNTSFVLVLIHLSSFLYGMLLMSSFTSLIMFSLIILLSASKSMILLFIIYRLYSFVIIYFDVYRSIFFEVFPCILFLHYSVVFIVSLHSHTAPRFPRLSAHLPCPVHTERISPLIWMSHLPVLQTPIYLLVCPSCGICPLSFARRR